jgi:uncharacterized membrane protein YphA (DoxX/SURF4 family)
MGIATLTVTIVLAAMVLFSGVGKLRHDPHIVKVIHDTIGVPLAWFPLLAAMEMAGAAGIVVGLWARMLGMVAGAGLVVYFAGAVVAHLRVGDGKGIGPAAFLLLLSAAAMVLRIAFHGTVL